MAEVQPRRRRMQRHNASHSAIGTIEGISGLSLDALSSVAYGPEAIVVVLSAAGTGALGYLRPITFAIVGLLAILVLSYRQVIAAYPDGGGAYAVGKDNLGVAPSLLAAASLIVDYVLTVAVSISAGVEALDSAFPSLTKAQLPICMALLVVLTVVNLFGIRESARALLLPTAVFLAGMYAVIAIGLIHPLGHVGTVTASPKGLGTVGVLLILKAFASGCSALTGVEAIANGTPSFADPPARSAQRTEVLLGMLLGSILLGLAELVSRFHLHEQANVTLLSQATQRAVGHGIFYYVVELSTTAVLALAANTSFGGLPVLGSLLAHDNFLPHVFALHGERPVYRIGVLTLGVLAGILLLVSGGDTQSLIPLYAIGVFIGFTISQVGLVRHWQVTREGNWRPRAALNALGAVLTASATVIFLATKFIHGAFVVVIAIPIFIWGFYRIHHYYERLAKALAIGETPVRPHAGQACLVIVPVIGLSKLTSAALSQALTFGTEVRALHVSTDDEHAKQLRQQWKDWAPGVDLVVVGSAGATVVKSVQAYLASPEVAKHRNLTVLIPVVEPRRLRHRLLLNQRAGILASVLRRTTTATVALYPFPLE